MGRIDVTALMVAAIVVIAAALPANAADVALFDDPTFVDSGSGDVSAEADNVLASVESLGHSVTTFSATDAAGIASALAGADVVLIPELENGDLGAALGAPAVQAYRDHLQAGGGMLVIGTTDQAAAGFLNRILETSMQTGAVGPAMLTTDAFETLYGAGPSVLPENSRTRGIDLTSLPPDPLAVYINGTRAPVARVTHGLGRVVYLGWDWFDGAPAGSQDGGWLQVLDLAVADAALCRDTSNGDIDGDGIADACDEVEELCADVDGLRTLDVLPKVLVKQIADDPLRRNDGLTLSGSFTLPADSEFADLDPQRLPFVLRLLTKEATLRFSVTLGTGAYGGKGTVGWRRGRAGRRWTYVDETASPDGGIVRVLMVDGRKEGPRRVRLAVTGKNSTYPFTVGDLPLEAVVSVGDAAAGQCAVTDFTPGDCKVGRSGKRLRCSRS